MEMKSFPNTAQKAVNQLASRRRKTLCEMQEIESSFGKLIWLPWALLAIAFALFTWAIIEVSFFDLVVERPLSELGIDPEAVISTPSAPTPLENLLDSFDLSQGRLYFLKFFSPSWLSAIFALLALFSFGILRLAGLFARLFYLRQAMESYGEQFTRFFSKPASRSPQSLRSSGGEDEFCSALPRNLRNRLSWWQGDPSGGETFQTAMVEIKRFLGDDGYYWFQACASLPVPEWHLVLFLGKGLVGKGLAPLYSDERADQLASLPWLMASHMPYSLRKYLVSELSEAQKNSIAHLLQCLIFSAVTGNKAEFALELAQKHTKFLQEHGAACIFYIARQLGQREQPLKDALFKSFALKKLPARFFVEKPVTRPSNRLLAPREYLESIAKKGCLLLIILTAITSLIGLINFKYENGYGGLKLNSNPNLAIVQLNGQVKRTPAVYERLPVGVYDLELRLQAYRVRRLKVGIANRVIANLGTLKLDSMSLPTQQERNYSSRSYHSALRGKKSIGLEGSVKQKAPGKPKQRPTDKAIEEAVSTAEEDGI